MERLNQSIKIAETIHNKASNIAGTFLWLGRDRKYESESQLKLGSNL